MKKNAFESFLYSVAGVVVLLLILVAVNVITGVFKHRIDLTKEKAYTLSDGTRAILAKIKTPVKIRFFYSSHAELPANALFLKTYAQRVQDMLSEYREASGGKLIVEQFDPQPDSDAEDAARLNGVEGKPISADESFYLGASISLLDANEVISFFDPDRERLLEYDLSRAISRVVTPEKPVIGIMSGVSVFGTPSNPMMEQMGQHAQEPWALVSELKNDFEVRQVEMTTDRIDDDIKVLLVIRPKEITDKAQFAIDQFVLRGGKLVAFLDPVSLLDKNSQSSMMGGQMPGGGSSLDKLVKAWGLEFDTSKAVGDLKFMNRQVRLGSGDNPCWIELADDGLNKDDVVTSEAGDLWVPFSGAFTGTPAAGLKETVLLHSSTESQLVEALMAAISGDNVMKDFKPSGTSYAMAVRLTGKFKTAFPNGKPQDPADGTNQPPAAPPSLKEGAQDTAVVLVGSSDMFANEFSLQQVQTPFGVISQPRNGNLNLAQSIVDNLAGDTDLISVRSRATTSHPFTRIEAMNAKAEEIYQGKINEYEQSLQDTREKLAELQKNKDQGQQRFILSPEQQAEIEKLRKKEAETNQALKQERKKLKHDIDATKNWVEWGNIIGMPLLVTISGLGLAGLKRKRTSAK
ncbi:MAG TPA: Gldg family protein [Verrucomicrobiae bacterium]|nr:Gldg family protein [Verrucomicrobiae bacterium]